MNQKKDNEIMKVLKASDLSHVVAYTNKGILTLKLVFGTNEYRYFLDSVQLDKEIDEALKKILQ